MVEAFLAAVPKVELHLHLVGSASPATVTRLAAAHPEAGVPTDEAALEAFFAFTDFPHFIEVYSAVNDLVVTTEDVAEVLAGAGRDLAAQRVRYAEMTVTPSMHVLRGLPYGAFVEGLDEGRRRAAAAGVELAWVYDIPGEHGAEAAEATVRWATEEPADGLVGFGLAGAEAGVDRRAHAAVFARARAAGLHSVPHAGEGDGPESVRAALDHLGAERIGHGVRAVEDEDLLRRLVDEQVPLEVCPSSNVCTRVAPSIEEHPVGRLLEAGAVVTLHTDDPPMFATTLTREHQLVADAFGLGVPEVADLVRASIDASFLADDRKRALRAEVDAVEAEARAPREGGS